jgi:dipeptidyl-peptidase-4
VDEDKAWVDLRHKFDWYKSDTHRLVLSEQDGWRHVYRVGLADHSVTQITRGDYDVIDLVGSKRTSDSVRWLYFTASPDNAVQRYLYRVPLAGGNSAPQRLTPADQPGHHSYDVAPNGRWAFHTYSAMGRPPVTDLVALPSHSPLRILEDNTELVEKLAQLELGEHEFFRVAIEPEDGGDSLPLDGWMIKPPGFDRSGSKKYPVLFYVYTEPWGQTARDVWGGERYLWHLLLSQRGYLIITVDNRGTPAPRGRAWRKAIYGKIGIVNVADQAAAAKKILAWPFVDESRVGVWGWSGGGSMTLNAMFQHPEIYHVGISVAPVGDQRLYDTIYQERYMGLPDENTVGFEQGSPVTHASKLAGKLLLVHGTGDDNVHYQNAEVVMNELIKHNRPFDMMSYPNRSHSIREGDNTRLHLFELLTRYLTTNLPVK